MRASALLLAIEGDVTVEDSQRARAYLWADHNVDTIAREYILCLPPWSIYVILSWCISSRCVCVCVCDIRQVNNGSFSSLGPPPPVFWHTGQHWIALGTARLKLHQQTELNNAQT